MFTNNGQGLPARGQIPMAQRQVLPCACGWKRYRATNTYELHRDALDRKKVEAVDLVVRLECERCGRVANLDPDPRPTGK